MANICRSLRKIILFSPVLKSPTHIGFIGVKKNGSKISHLGTFKGIFWFSLLRAILENTSTHILYVYSSIVITFIERRHWVLYTTVWIAVLPGGRGHRKITQNKDGGAEDWPLNMEPFFFLYIYNEITGNTVLHDCLKLSWIAICGLSCLHFIFYFHVLPS